MNPSKILGREPVLWLAAINAVVALAIGFGLDISTENQALIQTAVTAVLALVARGQVTPVASNDDRGQSALVTALIAAAVCLVLLLAFDLIHIG